jgi:hypothetical protein
MPGAPNARFRSATPVMGRTSQTDPLPTLRGKPAGVCNCEKAATDTP